ncbi:MAG TPA: excinuclease ABC subunit UvrA [Acidobacteriota bacterium]|nr:excinuclease ABC subunit UvrA [Acidobacteriota bacterium]
MGSRNDSEAPLRIWGARQNNLKDIDVEIPSGSLTVVTGVSGSGKSSLVFDTLYAEGQRRYVESLSAYARQFLERLDKPLVREIEGLRPAIAIRQRNSSRNPRSTVGTVTEIYDYLRLLYARMGSIRCRRCGRDVRRDSAEDAVNRILELPEGTRLYLTFPFRDSLLDLGREGQEVELAQQLESCMKQGFQRFTREGEEGRPPTLQLPSYRPQSLEELAGLSVLVDRIAVHPDQEDRITDSVETCLTEGNGVLEVWVLEDDGIRKLRFSERLECQYCQIDYLDPEPRLFSFNNPYGACPTCQGFGNTMTIDPDLVIPDPRKTIDEQPIDPFTKPRYKRFQKRFEDWATRKGVRFDVPYRDLDPEIRKAIWEGDGAFAGVKGFFKYLERKKYKMHVRIFISRYRGYSSCPDCGGERLRPEALDVLVGGRRITEVTTWPISESSRFFNELEISDAEQKVADKLLREIRQRLGFLVQVGLDYLTLDRLTSTLSGGEMQRIQLSASLSSSLVGTLYVLDEPSIGLHPRDENRLIQILKRLRDLGNTIVVVEHDREMMEQADHVIDIGPGAGEHGGELVHQGDFESLLENGDSPTGNYLAGRQQIPTPTFRRSCEDRWMTLFGARQHNLKDITVRLPLGVMTCVTGVSGSGKSTLVQDVLYPALKKLKGEWKGSVGAYQDIDNEDLISEAVLVDQTPIGRTPRSNPATYTKAFDDIRKLFANTRESRSRGLTPGNFSFNIPGGRCETCQGSGTITVEMQFLADVELLCEECRGKRYQKKVLDVTYKGKNIADVLDMTVSQALRFFKQLAPLVRKLRVLEEVGLGYLRLGQSATTLSGGEAQRLKLASYLSAKTSRHPLFIFDEPTTGLHFDDISKLLRSFDRLLTKGATVLVIEHNLDVIRSADWIIDLGPEGGAEGGRIVAQGTPEDVAQAEDSHTARFLRKILSPQPAT